MAMNASNSSGSVGNNQQNQRQPAFNNNGANNYQQPPQQPFMQQQQQQGLVLDPNSFQRQQQPYNGGGRGRGRGRGGRGRGHNGGAWQQPQLVPSPWQQQQQQQQYFQQQQYQLQQQQQQATVPPLNTGSNGTATVNTANGAVAWNQLVANRMPHQYQEGYQAYYMSKQHQQQFHPQFVQQQQFRHPPRQQQQQQQLYPYQQHQGTNVNNNNMSNIPMNQYATSARTFGCPTTMQNIDTSDPEHVDSALLAGMPDIYERYGMFYLEQQLAEFFTAYVSTDDNGQNTAEGRECNKTGDDKQEDEATITTATDSTNNNDDSVDVTKTDALDAATTVIASSSASSPAWMEISGPYNTTYCYSTPNSESDQSPKIHTHFQAFQQYYHDQQKPSSDGNPTSDNGQAQQRPSPPFKVQQTSFQRCLLHRLADRFGLIRENGKLLGMNSLRLVQQPYSTIPKLTVQEFYENHYSMPPPDSTTKESVPNSAANSNGDDVVGATDDNGTDEEKLAQPQQVMGKMKIMKRGDQQQKQQGSKIQLLRKSSNGGSSNNLEDRERKYAEARARIFAVEDQQQSDDGGEGSVAELTKSLSAHSLGCSNDVVQQQSSSVPISRNGSQISLESSASSLQQNSNGATTQQQPPIDTNPSDVDNSTGLSKAVYRNREQEQADPDFRRHRHHRSQQQQQPMVYGSAIPGYAAPQQPYQQQYQQPCYQQPYHHFQQSSTDDTAAAQLTASAKSFNPKK